MAYLLPGAVPASGDGDLVTDAGFAVNSLNVRHTPLRPVTQETPCSVQ